MKIMKSVLVTGANGYIGRHVAEALKENCDVTKLTHQQIDLTDLKAVKEFFYDKHFDWVIHCAITGGRYNETVEDGKEVLINNCCMFRSLAQCENNFDNLISFGSGAELSRSNNYALSKRYIAASMLHIPHFYNIRLFGVFSADELDDRFIKANLIRYIKKEPMIVHCDKCMDFIAVEDLMTIVENYILNDDILILPKTLDAIYSNKYTLLDLCKYINFLDKYTVKIEIQSDKIVSDYVGIYNDKFMKYCEVYRDIESIHYRISRMHKKLKEQYGTESK